MMLLPLPTVIVLLGSSTPDGVGAVADAVAIDRVVAVARDDGVGTPAADERVVAITHGDHSLESW